MARRVLAIERSSLARNVYSIILSKLDKVEVVRVGGEESISDIQREVSGFDLIIISQSTVGKRRDEYYKMLEMIFKEFQIPCVIIVHQGSEKAWKDFEKLKGVKVVERPFFPDDFLEIVKKLWRIR